ncbi:MAG: hypothetical protein ACRDWS_06120 [Acidimicrobiia bacterium]
MEEVSSPQRRFEKRIVIWRRFHSMIACNSDRNVTWVHSYVSLDRRKTHVS